MTRVGLAAVIGLAVLLLIGCGEDEATSPPPTGSIEVSVTMTGSVPDGDGFLIAIDGSDGDVLSNGETLRISGLAAREHTVTISDVAPNCTVQGEESRSVSVSADQTTIVSFVVVCPAFGSLRISTSSGGSSPPDPDGYTVTLVGDTSFHMGVTDTVAFPSTAARDYVIEVTGVAANCVVTGENPRTITVAEGEAKSVLLGVACPPFHDYIAFYSDRRYYETPEDEGLYVVKPDGTGLFRLAHDSLDYNYPTWSPDGARIAFTRCDEQSCASSDLYVLDIAEQRMTRVTQDAGASLASWSPSGDKFVYDSYKGHWTDDTWGDIYVINEDGSNPVNLTPGSETGYDPSWSPDGSWIVYDTGDQIWVMQADGSEKTQLTDLPNTTPGYWGSAYEAAWSPDGTRIAFGGPGLGDGQRIWLMDADGSNTTLLTDYPPYYHAHHPSWSPDGTKIAFWAYKGFAEGPAHSYEIYLMDADGSNEVNLTNHAGYDVDPAWSPAP